VLGLVLGVLSTACGTDPVPSSPPPPPPLRSYAGAVAGTETLVAVVVPEAPGADVEVFACASTGIAEYFRGPPAGGAFATGSEDGDARVDVALDRLDRVTARVVLADGAVLDVVAEPALGFGGLYRGRVGIDSAPQGRSLLPTATDPFGRPAPTFDLAPPTSRAVSNTRLLTGTSVTGTTFDVRAVPTVADGLVAGGKLTTVNGATRSVLWDVADDEYGEFRLVLDDTGTAACGARPDGRLLIVGLNRL
jgi:hypothetical protein